MKLNQIKIIFFVIMIFPLLAIVFTNSGHVRANATADEDVAATYKTKCAICHSPKAEKFFDATKTDDQLIDVVLKGKKGEKPPYMPAFETKGMTTEQAKALVTYMRQLKEQGN